MTQTDFGNLIGATRGQIASYESGDAKPKVQISDAICKKFNISISELFNNDLSLKKNLMVAEPSEHYGNVKHLLLTNDKKNLVIVPLKAFGGFLTGYENKIYLDSLQRTSFPWVQSECFGFEIEGFSMSPDYPTGSFVITTPLEKFEWMQKQKDYVFQTIDGIILKRFIKLEGEYCHVKSINEEYDSMKIHRKQIKRIYYIEYKINKP